MFLQVRKFQDGPLSTDRLTDWLIALLIGCMLDWVIDWLMMCVQDIDWLLAWWSNWLIADVCAGHWWWRVCVCVCVQDIGCSLAWWSNWLIANVCAGQRSTIHRGGELPGCSFPVAVGQWRPQRCWLGETGWCWWLLHGLQASLPGQQEGWCHRPVFTSLPPPLPTKLVVCLLDTYYPPLPCLLTSYPPPMSCELV